VVMEVGQGHTTNGAGKKMDEEDKESGLKS
jgi:hypothetical protein